MEQKLYRFEVSYVPKDCLFGHSVREEYTGPIGCVDALIEQVRPLADTEKNVMVMRSDLDGKNEKFAKQTIS